MADQTRVRLESKNSESTELDQDCSSPFHDELNDVCSAPVQDADEDVPKAEGEAPEDGPQPPNAEVQAPKVDGDKQQNPEAETDKPEVEEAPAPRTVEKGDLEKQAKPVEPEPRPRAEGPWKNLEPMQEVPIQFKEVDLPAPHPLLPEFEDPILRKASSQDLNDLAGMRVSSAQRYKWAKGAHIELMRRDEVAMQADQVKAAKDAIPILLKALKEGKTFERGPDGNERLTDRVCKIFCVKGQSQTAQLERT
ncbi:MAG: hypothetical protein SGJ27_26495 [Candidatus Melainabacteria bacterium]|nr:hypothetical protein [Candidatus Melainabacteria bacterium]